MPHEATGEKPSFLLLGMDCRTSTEVALLPPTLDEIIPDVEEMDYCKEMILSLSTVREAAASSIQQAQKYKAAYDQNSSAHHFRIADWVLVKLPQGANHKLSRPWHGPYRIVDIRDPDVTVVKVYCPQDCQIKVHQLRVILCPRDFPAGYFWYGNRRSGPGQPPKWVDHAGWRNVIFLTIE